MEKIKDIVAQMPEETQHVDELLEKVLPKKTLQKNDLEEFASHYPDTPIFERKEPSKGIDVVEKESSTTFPIDQSIKTPPISSENQLDKPRSLNDKLNKGLNIGLNDRIAFINHLFDGNAEEYGSVLSKIGEMNSFDEASSFIIESIKPKFGDWHNKDEYSERFVAIVEKSFS